MNHNFKSIFNRRTGTWQVVSENVRNTGKTGCSVQKSLLAMAMGLSACTAMAQTSPIDGGQVVTISPTQQSPWNVGSNLIVGDTGSGTLNIENGGKVSNVDGYIGVAPNSTGAATVTGAGSTWENSAYLEVGGSGNGTLTIKDGGEVSNLTSSIGKSLGSTGTATVSGAGSTWQNSGFLDVGDSGNGTLIIENGGKANNSTGFIGYGSGGNGTVTVTGAGSIWENSAFLEVGGLGNGTLIIENGGRVNNTTGSISAGTATVTGADSAWENSDSLIVGTFGNGTLVIENGGKVNNTTGYLGFSSSVTGTATVTGVGSTWENSDFLHVGGSGSGTLTIKDGGRVASSYLVLARDITSNGTLELAGNRTTRGLLSTSRIVKGAGDIDFKWNGGILQATGNQSDFLQGFAANDITIGSKGAYLDTQGYQVDISTADILTGTGGLTKLGAGTLSIAGDNSYSGNTTIAEGTLQFASYSQSANQVLGIGAHGSSNQEFGKLYVTGNASFNTNANIDVNVATINTLAVNNTLANVIKVDGTLDAAGFKVTDNSALFDFLAIQKPNAVDLKIISNSTTGTGIRDTVIEHKYWSALNAADVLDNQLNNSATGDMGKVIQAFGQLPSNRDVARAAVQTLPIISDHHAIQGTLSTIQKLVQQRTSGTSISRGLASGDTLSNKNAWGKVFGSRADQDDLNGYAGFKADTWGLILGADADLTPDARFGVAYAYAKTAVDGNTDISNAAQRANIGSHIMSAYGRKDIGGNRSFSFQGDIGLNNSKSTRYLDFGGLNRTARADYRTYSAHVGAAISQAFDLSAQTTLTPTVRADYSWLKSQAYNESGAGALNLQVAARKTDALLLGTDVYLQHRYSNTARLDANLGLAYDVINKPGYIVATYAGAPSMSFRTPGMEHSPWLLRAGVGYSKQMANGPEINLRYDAEGRNDYLNHTASVRAKWTF